MGHVSIFAPLRKPSRIRWLTVGLSLFILAAYATHWAWSRSHVQEGVDQAATELWLDTSQSLNYPHPRPLARENLRNDSHYVTGFAISGFTNEFIAYMHIVYLGMLSGRTPIVPPFVPTAHIIEDAPPLLFSSIFNLTFARSRLRLPILEWADVKTPFPDVTAVDDTDPSDPALESFGCWSLRQRSYHLPTWVTEAENVLKLDLSYTRVPPFAYLNPSNENDEHTTFAALTSLILPKHPHPGGKGLPIMLQSRFGKSMDPTEDEQLSCFDFLYYVSTGMKAFEFEERWSPAWNLVGTHLRFNDDVVDVAKEYVGRAMGLQGGDIPPLITVHARRGDFGMQCNEGETYPCFTPLSIFSRAVEDVRRRLKERRNISVSQVLIASDEEDLAFWAEVEKQGWHYINHTSERTVEQFGDWYPIILDKAALSLGQGFVGTRSSTFSTLTARRVEDWNDGDAVLVQRY